MSSPSRFTRVLLGLVIGLAAAGATVEASAGGMTVRQVLENQNANPRVLPPGSMPNGKSYADWGVEWWRWALSFPWATNPMNDPTGAFNEQGQSGQVWFLAGNTGGTSVRSVSIPAGNAILFPIFNADLTYPCPDPTFEPAPGQSLEDFLQGVGDFVMGQVASMNAELDGVSLGNLFDYRAQSGLSTVTGNPDLIANFDPCITGSPQSFVSDGYWLMLSPLAPGAHTLHFAGSVPAFGFSLDVTYNITVTGGGRNPVTVTGMKDASGESSARTTSWGRIKVIYR